VGVWFVVGEPAWGVEGWRLSHQQAQAAFVVALRRPRAFTRYGDVALLASALKDELLAGTLVEVYLAPLDRQRDRGAVSRQTLRAYFAAARNTTSAAAGLGVARRTVENRLRAIETLLGRPLHRCSAELEVALHLHDMVPAPIRRVPFSAADSRMR
jgi:DNA-binding PucR family transcriptional regulator